MYISASLAFLYMAGKVTLSRNGKCPKWGLLLLTKWLLVLSLERVFLPLKKQ